MLLALRPLQLTRASLLEEKTICICSHATLIVMSTAPESVGGCHGDLGTFFLLAVDRERHEHSR